LALRKLFIIPIAFILLISFFTAEGGSEVRYVNKDRIAFKGTADPGSSIIVYVNGEQVLTTTADDAGNWAVRDVQLTKEGENIVYAKAKDKDGRESNASQILRVVLDRSRPELKCTVSPTKTVPGQTINISVAVSKTAGQVNAAMPMTWIVLPSPISSLRMPLMPFWKMLDIHRTPYSWCASNRQFSGGWKTRNDDGCCCCSLSLLSFASVLTSSVLIALLLISSSFASCS
jgi:hypothetical protein